MISKFKIFKPYENRLFAGTTLKKIGSFNNEKVQIPDTKMGLIFLNQIHKDDVIKIEKKPQIQISGDALITQEKGIPLSIKVADCQGVLIYDPKTESIGAVHSGWRSSSLDIIGKTIKKMQSEFESSPSDLLVGISPSLGPCCAEFTDPKKELPDFIHPYINKNKVDFWSLSLAQCMKVGIPEDQIEITKTCTKCHSDKYFSHRNKDTGRMAVFIGLK